MSETIPVRLDLRTPLFYEESPGLEPFLYGTFSDSADNGEKTLPPEQLFCFELDPAQSQSIEPVREQFFGRLLFSGHTPQPDTPRPPTIQLPAGIYLFSQKRDALERPACVDMAIEQQKDGLWERHLMQNRLYIRYLFEDGSPVTQFFRPLQ